MYIPNIKDTGLVVAEKKIFLCFPNIRLCRTSVKGSILTKLIEYRESMVLIICTKNESNLTNRY